jgi:hypothetical protein
MPTFLLLYIMFKKICLFLILAFGFNRSFSQVLYSERFNGQSLTTGTFTANSMVQTYLYNDVPTSMFTINNGDKVADTITANYPFRATGQKLKAWMSYRPAAITNITDTFAVSTSWLNPEGSADAWLVTPTINNIAANTVLTWEAMAPDIINADGYEVYVTTNTTAVVPATGDFTSSNRLLTVNGESSQWKTRGVSLAAYAGLNIRVAFRNNSSNKYQLWLDDIVVENITNGFDASADINNTYKYSTTSINNYISATFKNNAYTPITNITINYQLGSNSTVTETQSLASPINYLENRQLTFTTPFISLTAAYYPLKIWVSAINGQADQVSGNDTIMGSLTLSTAIPAKNILLEEFTSTKCGWCPNAALMVDTVKARHSNVIAAAIHTNDQMEIAEGATLAGDYASSLPAATIDQFYFTANDSVSVGAGNWDTYITQRASMNVPVTVTVTGISYNSSTNQIDATVSASFVGDVKGDYRLNLYVKENNIYGPHNDPGDNGWNQYNFLYNAPSSPYYQLGNSADPNFVMNGEDYKHKNVIDYIAGGAYGTAGVIPATGGTAGQTYTQTYTYTLPITTGEFRYNPDNMYLIGIVSEYNADTKQRTILNAAEVKLTGNPEVLVGVKEFSQEGINMTAFPNPSTGACYLRYVLAEPQTVNVSVYNTLGETVYLESLNTNAGTTTHTLNLEHLPQGNYSVIITLKNNTVTKKITIIK